MSNTALDSSPAATGRQRSLTVVRDCVAATLGAFFEWFDLLVYASFALPIAKVFYHEGDADKAFLLSTLTFASAYLARPLGAIFLGIYSDKQGRRAALMLSAVLMLIGTAMIALLPGYDTLGSFAPVGLLFARVLQGIAAGGEFGSVNAYLTERFPKLRALMSSLQFSMTGLALLVASLAAYAINHYLSPEQVMRWGWRLPFLFGCLIAPVAFYMRSHISETEAFLAETAAQRAALGSSLGRHWKAVILGALVVAGGNAASYLNIFMPNFAIKNFGLSAEVAFTAGALSAVVCIVFPLVAGRVADRAGFSRTMTIAMIVGLIGLGPVYYNLMQHPGLPALALFQCFMSLVFYSFYYSPVGALLADLFPTQCRTMGVSVAYVISQSLFGGLTPLVVGMLVVGTGSNFAAAGYLLAIGVVAIVALRVSRLLPAYADSP
ncbi:MAG TPA: MFS transporter [Bordetella sp.]